MQNTWLLRTYGVYRTKTKVHFLLHNTNVFSIQTSYNLTVTSVPPDYYIGDYFEKNHCPPPPLKLMFCPVYKECTNFLIHNYPLPHSSKNLLQNINEDSVAANLW